MSWFCFVVISLSLECCAFSSDISSEDLYTKTMHDLSSFFLEEPDKPSLVISKFQESILPQLAQAGLLSLQSAAVIFRSAFVAHLTHYEIALSDQQLAPSKVKVYQCIDKAFPAALLPWEQFIEDVGLFSGETPNDDAVKEAFEKVRQATRPQYRIHEDKLRRQFNALIAYNSLLQLNLP